MRPHADGAGVAGAADSGLRPVPALVAEGDAGPRAAGCAADGVPLRSRTHFGSAPVPCPYTLTHHRVRNWPCTSVQARSRRISI